MVTDLASCHRVAVFLTRGSSLTSWHEAGILDRELAIYRRLAGRGWSFLMVTYGEGDEAGWLEEDEGIEVACNSRGLPARLYEMLLPLLHAVELRRCDVFKTNQTNGADVAQRSARMLGRPLVARCGYMWSDFALRQCGADSREARRAQNVERRVFATATRLVVTTEQMQCDVQRRIGRSTAEIFVVPNYVDTELFRPHLKSKDRDRVVFVGRLAPQKNVGALLQAAANLGLEMTIVGDGPDKDKLMSQFRAYDGVFKWVSRVPHINLPEVFARASVFVLPSHYEGHPKALLEAMACGLTVVGTNVPGIKEVIKSRVTGILCGTGSEDLEMALKEVIDKKDLMKNLGEAARQYVLENFSLERIALLEERALRDAVCAGTKNRVV